MNTEEPILEISDLVVEFDAGMGRKIHAVSGVSLRLKKGETMGLVGESGCGKSSIARAVIQLPKPTSGRVLFRGEDLTRVDARRLRMLRPGFQMIFQDSVAALNPRRKVGQTIAMPLRINSIGDRTSQVSRAREMMKSVGLDPDALNHQPFQFSGGQCQRIQIARALMMKPELLICDEPVSSLDVSIQAQIINLLEKMKARYGLTMLFISHDLAVVKNISDRVAVMYLGKLCEIADAEDLYQFPHHPYSEILMTSIPDPEQQKKKANIINYEMPSPVSPPSGCRFHTRCPKAQSICSELEPELTAIKNNRQVACHFPLS